MSDAIDKLQDLWFAWDQGSMIGMADTINAIRPALDEMAEARAEIARLTAELAAARAVTAGVCRYLDCAAADLLAVVTSLYESDWRARAIAAEANAHDAHLRAARLGSVVAHVVDAVGAKARGAGGQTVEAMAAALADECERLRARIAKAEEVVAAARTLGSYAWTDRLDDSRTSDDAKEDESKLSSAVWQYDNPPNLHPDGCHTTAASAFRDCSGDGHHECRTCARFDEAERTKRIWEF